jgi:hypothetical protein
MLKRRKTLTRMLINLDNSAPFGYFETIYLKQLSIGELEQPVVADLTVFYRAASPSQRTPDAESET